MSAFVPKRILITGTSTGVGAALAVMLAKQGHKVWATMRNLDKSDSLREAAAIAGTTLTISQLDVEKSDSVKACVGSMISTEGGIDVLVNNAGAGFVRTTEQASEEEIQWVMNLNFMGVVRCTKEVLPHMRAARSGHIVNISSVGGLVGQPFNEIYCAAKFAVEGYTESLASYLQPGFNLKFTVVEPGGIATEFKNSVLSQVQSTGGIHDDEYKPLLMMYLSTAQKRAGESDASAETAAVYQTAEQVAAVISDVIHSPNPPVRVRTSEWAETFCSLKTASDPDGKKLQLEVATGMLGAKSATELA